jgi:hypothetical protein
MNSIKSYSFYGFRSFGIQERYKDNLRLYDKLRAAILAAWKAVDGAFLMGLLESMPARCQAVIDADGIHTRC